MAAYVAQRLGAVMVIMVAMSVLLFLATHALPSNAAALILGQYSTPETQAALEHRLGFDQPLPVQYWRWASHMLQGDMGQSFEMERPVAPILTYFRRLAAGVLLGPRFHPVIREHLPPAPSSGYANLSDGLGGFIAHLVLPVATLT